MSEKGRVGILKKIELYGDQKINTLILSIS
jgi:hypothetical protein